MDDGGAPIQVNAAEWRIVLDILGRHVPEREVWAFGSRATGAAWRYSDLDLMVLGDAPLPTRLVGDLREAFSLSDLPWRVDIVDGADADPSFHERVAADKVVIQRPLERTE